MLQTFDPAAMPVDSVPAPRQEWAALKSLSFDELMSRLVSDLVDFAIHLAIAILVFYAGRFVIRRIYNIVGSIMTRRKADVSLSSFVLSLIRIVLYFILIVTVIGILGINTSSFIAIFASVGVAIGMALSGTLQNFAGGVLILLLKPYRVKDYIEAQGFAGTVTEIQIFSTVICTPDNKKILIPNGALSTGSINNWSGETYRRVQWDIGISYGDDFDRAATEIHAIIRSVKEVLYLDASNKPVLNPEGTVSAVEYNARKNGSVDSVVVSGNEEQSKSADETAEETPAAEEKMGFWKRLLRRQHQKAVEREKRREEAVKALAPSRVQNPSVNLASLGDSSVNLTVRAWAHTADYWAVYYYVLEQIYARQTSSGFSFPFPQMDVHIVSPSGAK